MNFRLFLAENDLDYPVSCYCTEDIKAPYYLVEIDCQSDEYLLIIGHTLTEKCGHKITKHIHHHSLVYAVRVRDWFQFKADLITALSALRCVA